VARHVWSASTTRGAVDVAVEPTDDGRWRYSVLCNQRGRISPLSQGVAASWQETADSIDAALGRAGVASRPSYLGT
jgi:hypothetical protein